MTIDPRAASGFASVADAYERGRPSYPAEAIPLRDGEVDAVVVGEAFHWFETARATAEIARVLTPGGGIALLHVELEHEQRLDPRGFVGQVASWSWIANLDGAQRHAVLEDVHALVPDHQEIVIPYRTDLYLARRRVA